MKQLLLRYVPLTLLIVVIGGVVVHAPLTVYAGTVFPAISTPLKAWKEVLIIVAAILIAIRMLEVGQWKTLMTDRFGWVIIGYWLVHCVALLWTDGTLQSTVAGLFIDLRYTLFAACVYHFILLYPEYRKLLIKVFIGGACVVVGFAMLQLILPKDILSHIGYGESTIQPYLTVDKNPEYVRFNSTLRGPNSLGAYAVIVLAGVVAYGLRYGRRPKPAYMRALHLFLGIGSLVALWVSYSRSALVAGMIAVGLLLYVRYRSQLSPKVWTALAAVLIVVAVIGYSVRDTSFVHNVILHDNPTTGGSLSSNDEHAASLNHGFGQMLKEPLGAGIGSTGSASLLGDRPVVIENQYLMIAHESGWIGLILYLWIFIIFLVRSWHRRRDWLEETVFASGIGLALIGLLLPVWADDTVAIIWWGLAALALAKGVFDERTTNKKAKRTT